MIMKKILISYKVFYENYVNAIEALGAKAVAEYLPTYSDEYDALILSGGGDIHPKYYNEEIKESVRIDTQRDEAEFKLLDEFLKAGKPILGICRGCQVINVYFGGSLFQEIDNFAEHKPEPEQKLYNKVASIKDSVANKLYGDEFVVNSYHHQAIKKLGNGLKATHKCGNIIEGIEHETLPIIAYQWHPEKISLSQKDKETVDGIKIFEHFLSLIK